MAIDDPLDAADSAVAADERSDSPLAKYAPDLAEVAEAVPAEMLPFGLSNATELFKTVGLAFGWVVRKREEERRRYLVDNLRNELRRVRSKLERLDEEYRRFLQGEFWDLVTDGLQKAERTRSRSRIHRIGTILANAAIEGTERPADLTEELMRIAMDIDDDATRVLGELVRGQRAHLRQETGRVDDESVNNYWRSGLAGEFHTSEGGPAMKLGITEGQLQSQCSKLQAFGLIVQVPPKPMKVGLGVVPYSVLQKATDFIDAIRSPQPDDKDAVSE